jgi:hypothetical protein
MADFVRVRNVKSYKIRREPVNTDFKVLKYCDKNSNNCSKFIQYNTKINKYLELSVAMRNLWCLEKISILPLVISATGIVPQSLFKNLKILDLDNTLVVEI